MMKTSHHPETEARFNSILDEYGKFLRAAIAKLCPTDLGLQYNDIEQDARIRLWQALERGNEINNLTSYLYRIAATATIDAVRRIKARREEQLRVEDEGDEGEKAIPLLAPLESSPERLVERRQLREKVIRAFGRMAENRRSAVP